MLAHLITSATFALSLFEGIAAVSSNSGIDIAKRTPTPDAKLLFPYRKRALGLRARDIVRQSLHPQTSVALSYGQDHFSQEQHLFAVDLKLTCHDSIPIVLLEDFEDLTSTITCSDETIKITFPDGSDFDYTKNKWGTSEEFIVIASHPEGGCSPSGERSAYRVTHIDYDEPTSTIVLSTESIALADAASKMSVDFGHIPRDQFHGNLIKRQTTPEEIADDNEDDTFNFHVNSTVSLNTSFPTRITLWPLTDVGVDAGNNGGSPIDVQVTCVDCGVSGELIFRGHLDQDFTLDNGTDIQWAWGEIEVTKAIKTNLQLELFLGLALSKEWEFDLLPAPISISPFQIPGLISIGPDFEYALIVALNFGATEFNFTYGVTVDIPVNSIARFDFVETNNSFSRGWDKTEISLLPFTINSLGGSMELSLNVTAQPSVGFKVSILSAVSDGLTAGPALSFAAPKFMLAAAELSNVTKSCAALGPDDYEYYEDAFQFSTNWELGVSVSVSAEADFPLLPALGASWSQDLYTHTFDPDLTCKVLGGANRNGVLEPTESVSPKIDINKLAATVNKTGVLPPGIDPKLLATYTAGGPLPTNLEGVVEDKQKGSGSNRTVNGVGIIGLLISVGCVAMML